LDLAALDLPTQRAHRSGQMLHRDLAPFARDRKELLAEYPLLVGTGAGQHRLLDECLEVLALFDGFALDIAADAQRLDRAGPNIAVDALEAILETACKRRLFSLVIPRSLGGSGYSMLALSVGLEHLAQLCVGVTNLVAAHGLALAVVGATGQLRLLRLLADGIVAGEKIRKAYLLATAATEPSAGSDLEDFEAMGRAQIESHADPIASGYALFGRKIYVSNGGLASAYVVVMPTDRTCSRATLSAFLVFAETSGLTVVRTEEKLGQRACPAAELYFDGCQIPHEHRLNEGSIAGRTLDLVLGSSRATVASFGAGVARGVFVTSRRIAAQLQGKTSRPLVEHPHAKALLSRMWTNATLARYAYLGAADVQRRVGLVSLMESEPLRALDRIVPSRMMHGPWVDKLLGWDGIDREARRLLSNLEPTDIAMASVFGSAAKVQTSELALANCTLAQELLGPEATREDSGIPKYWRDARLLSIYEGTNEICALDVAQKLPARKNGDR
jgi:acyl-CoA dehydrogenase